MSVSAYTITVSYPTAGGTAVAPIHEIRTEVVNGVEWTYMTGFIYIEQDSRPKEVLYADWISMNPNGASGLMAVPGYWGVYIGDGTNAAVSASISGHVNVPSELGGMRVIGISANAFWNCTGMTGVTVPDTVLKIQEAAFGRCSGLEEMTLPFIGEERGVDEWAGWTVLGWLFGRTWDIFAGAETTYYDNRWEEREFDGGRFFTMDLAEDRPRITKGSGFCLPAGLKKLTITDETVLARKALCDQPLTEVVLPETLRSMYSGTFENMPLKQVVIPSGIKTIEDSLFSGCTSLTNVVLHSGVTKIGGSAFRNCINLKHIDIPASVTSIGGNAFNHTGLSDIPAMPGMKCIADEMFVDCWEMTKATIPEGITSIGRNAFLRCPLAEVTIPNTVTNIGHYAFDNQRLISEIEIPSSVKSIGVVAFRGCTNLTNIVLSEGLESIGDNAFSGCSALTNIAIPESVSMLGINEEGDRLLGSVFRNCTSLESVVLPSTLAELPSSTFYGCKRLVDVALPSNLKSIGDWAFYDCDALVAVDIPQGVTNLGSSVFLRCDGLERVSVPGSVARIEDDTFYLCTNLVNVSLQDGPQTIGRDAFYECKKLERINIPGSVRTIGIDAFKDCSGLSQVTFNEGLEELGWGAFRGCRNVQSLVLPSSLKVLGGAAFWGWKEISNVVIPSSVEVINSQAFEGCGGLERVEISDSVKTIDNSAFASCGMTAVVIPLSVTNIGEKAFSQCSRLKVVFAAVGMGDVISSAENIFEGCPDYLKVEYYEDEPPKLDELPTARVTFNANGGTPGETTLTILDGRAIGELPYASRASYGFAGWFTATEGGEEITEETIAQDGLTAYAHWVEPVFTIYYGALRSVNLNGATEIEIPDGVTSIGNKALYNCSSLTRVKIPNSVTSIGDYAFSWCEGLTSIMIPDSVTSIGECAFYYCRNLTSIRIGDGVSSIGESAFSGCRGLSSVTMPDGLTSIGKSAFSYCSHLANVTIPDSVMSIGKDAFNGCHYSLYDTTTIPGVKLVDGWAIDYTSSLSDSLDLTEARGVGVYAFYGCGNIRSVAIPQNVCSNGLSLFFPSAYRAITNVIISADVTSIGHGAFSDCDGLTSVTIPGSVTVIGDFAFSGCDSLTSVTILEGVTVIGDYVFSGCGCLASVLIPDSLTSIGDYAFESCNDSLYDTTTISGVILVDGWAIGNTESLSGGLDLTEVRGIGPRAFCNCCDLTSVTISDRVITIGDYAFSGCTGLASVTISSSAATIGNSAFAGCSGLTSVTIPDSVTNIGYNAFSECAGLTSVTIPGSVTTIGSSAFSGCSGLTSVTIPDSVTLIEDFVFSHCWRLASVTIPESVVGIGNSAFFECSGLNSIIIPDSVAIIGEYAFSGCRALSNVVIPNSVTLIGSSAFDDCTGVRSVTIPQYSLSLVFPSSYQSITNVIIADGATSIGRSAFSFCYGLTSVTIPDSVTDIGYYAFAYCGELSIALVPRSLEGQIHSSVFSNCASDFRIVYYDGSIDDLSWVKLAFNGNGGVVDSESINVLCGQTAGVMPDAQRAGYAFAGWFTAEEGGYQVAASTVVTSDMTLYAHWEDLSLCWEYYITGDDCAVITGGAMEYGDPLTGEVTIPSVVDGYKVSGISDYAFYGCDALASVVISDGILSIGEHAFDNCANLEYVSIPDSVICVASTAFANNSADLYDLDSISGVKLVDGWAIGYTWDLQSDLNLAGVRGIGDGAFSWCSWLTSVTIPNSVLRIGGSAFEGCSALTSVTMPNSVTSIGERAFSFCNRIQTFVVDEGNLVYSSVNGLLLSKDGKILIRGVNGDVVIPNGVTSIGDSAFSGCSGLTSVTIPCSVTSIWDYAFSDCNRIQAFVVDEGNIVYSSMNGLLLSKDGKILIRGINGDVVIPNGVTSIGDYAFSYSGLMNVIMPDSVKSIGDYAFFGCSGLACITLPDSVTSIGYAAFSMCSGLTIVTIPDSMTSIGDYAFSGCSSLSNVMIPNTVISIGNYVCSYCSTLSMAVVPRSLEGQISADAFLDCASDFRIVYYDGSLDDLLWVKLSFNGNGGVVDSESIDVLGGQAVGEMPVAQRAGYAFKGWFTAAEGGEQVTSETVASSNATLYAHWEECEFETGGSANWTIDTDGNWKSGEITHSQSTWIQKTVSGSGTLTFNWKVSSESNYDKLFFYIDGVSKDNISGAVDWIAKNYRIDASGNHTFKWEYKKDGSVSSGSDSGWIKDVVWTPDAPVVPLIEGDEGATVEGDADSGYVIKPTAAKTEVVVTIPEGVDASKVTVEISSAVESVKANGAMVKVVANGCDITSHLDIPAAIDGVVDMTKATVKEEVVKEAMDTSKGAEIDMTPASPTLTTAETKPGLTYTLREGTTLDGMTDGDSKVGDGEKWTPNITVKGGASGFYTIKVEK